MRLFYIILFVFIGFSAQTQAQINNHPQQQTGIYKDRITDQYGMPLSGIRVSVKGKGIHTYSDMDGFFSIRASNGDVIVLSKNGNRINSYRLDGSNDYEVKDLSEKVVNDKRLKKSKSFNTAIFLDSASYYLKKDAYKSIDFVEKHLKSKKSQSEEDLIRSYVLLGDNYMQLKQYDLAVTNYQNALKKKEDADINLKLAKAATKNKQFLLSNHVYLELLKQPISPWQEILCDEGLGVNAVFQNKNNEAINYYQQALKIAEKNTITSKISSLNAEIAKLLNKKGEKNKANLYIQNTIESANREPIKNRVAIQEKVADVYQENKDYDSEILIRKKSLAELEKAQVESLEIESEEATSNLSTSQLNLDIGRAYIDKNEFKKAIPYLEKSVSKANELKNLEVQKNAIKKLSELYKKIGNSKKALSNYQEYARLVEELYKQKEDEIQAATTLNNELRAKQNRINSLEKDRELSESRYQLSISEKELTQANYKKQQIIIYALLFGLLLFGIVLYFMFRSIKQKRLANNLLALKSLRSQMNPHFIFNALNSVNSFIAQNDERTANRYLTDFSKLMRNVLNNSEQDFIPLDKEIDLLKLYMQLEHSRFKDKFDYEINIDENIVLTEFQIPPMLLQPYVENAVWHGLRYKKSKGKLQIDFKQIDKETVKVYISDDGIGRKKSKELKTQNQKKQKSKGMGNIKKRIEILNEMYKDKVHVTITDLFDDQTGTKVILTLKRN